MLSNLVTDIQDPCRKCGANCARRDGLCSTCIVERDYPYTCHGCHGTGTLPMVRVGLRVAKPERACSICEGRGRITQEHALDELVTYAIAVCRTLDTRLVPPQLSEARRLGDERLLGFWRRVLAYAAREQSRQAWWSSAVSEEAVA